jgi:hypothetical protein
VDRFLSRSISSRTLIYPRRRNFPIREWYGKGKLNVKVQPIADRQAKDCAPSLAGGIYHSEQQDEMRATESNA